MTKCLGYMAPIALIGLMATQAPATAAIWSGNMVRDIAAATADRTDAPLVLVQRGGRGGGGRGGGGRGGGGYAGGGRGGAGGVNRGGGGGSWAGVSGGNRANVSGGNRGNFNSVNVNRNVNVVGGGGYYGGGWGGVAAGVAAGAVVGAAVSAPYYAAPAAYPYCPYPDYPNCGL